MSDPSLDDPSLDDHPPDDHRLVADAAAEIGVPRAEVVGDRFSFVLHAPLELLARAALLPHVDLAARRPARARIAILGEEYGRSGPPRPTPAAVGFENDRRAIDELAVAVGHGDHDTADRAASWLGERLRPHQLTGALADIFLPTLEAAGHANIYLALLPRTQPRGLPGQLLRHLVLGATADRPRRIELPVCRATGPGAPAVEDLLDRLHDVRPVDRPTSTFIAPLVEHAAARGVVDSLTDDGEFRSPTDPPFGVLRFAAQAMLQGPEERTPYGWTHCLTLAEAPLVMATGGAPVGPATFVAMAYLAAEWAGHGRGTVDPHFRPESTGAGFVEALATGPAAAAAAAWHTPDRGSAWSVLATRASQHHDAHRVKYTLACLDAAARDPAAEPLYLAAAAHLHAWWEQHGDPSDPRPDLATPCTDGVER